MYRFKIEEQKIDLLDIDEIKKLKKKYGDIYKFLEDEDGIYADFNFKKDKESKTAGKYRYNPPMREWLHLARREEGAASAIPVRLVSGDELMIIPAIALPRRIYFSSGKISEELYPRGTEYGRLAYEIYDVLAAGGDIPAQDEKIIKLIGAALKQSYYIPLEIWEAEEVISITDLQLLAGAALGIPASSLREQLKKFN